MNVFEMDTLTQAAIKPRPHIEDMARCDCGCGVLFEVEQGYYDLEHGLMLYDASHLEWYMKRRAK